MGNHIVSFSKMKTILFRADANPSIGSGDLISFIHLANRFKCKGWKPYFLIRNYPLGMSLINAYFPDNYINIDATYSVADEVCTINRVIETYNIDVVFFQINEVPISSYNSINRSVFKGCVYFDYDLPKGFDLVLSWNSDSHKYFVSDEHVGTKFFIGPEYVILPLSFESEAVCNRTFADKKEKILVAMGGADQVDMTRIVASKLIEINWDLNVRFILGEGYREQDALEKILANAAFNFEIERNVSNMLDEYMKCDLAIGSGGLTASELMASKTPSFLVATYEHQMGRCEYFQGKGWAKYMGYRDISALTKHDIFRFKPQFDVYLSPQISRLVDYIDGIFL